MSLESSKQHLYLILLYINFKICFKHGKIIPYKTFSSHCSFAVNRDFSECLCFSCVIKTNAHEWLSRFLECYVGG